MKIFLPWPPSANKIWRNLRGSRGLYLAKEYKRFVDESKIWLWKQGSPRVLGDENLEVVIKLYPPTKRGYDVDNRIKPTLDALTKVGFWRDDKIARKVTAIVCDTIPGGGAVVEIFCWRRRLTTIPPRRIPLKRRYLNRRLFFKISLNAIGFPPRRNVADARVRDFSTGGKGG